MDWLKINEEGEIEFITEEVKLVPEVQAILTLNYNKGAKDADGRKKFRAKAELKYLYLVYSFKSPYKDYTEKERIVEAKQDCGFGDTWVESRELKDLIPKFKKGNGNKVLNLLSTVHKFMDKFEVHLNTINLDERNASGGLVYKATDVMATLERLPRLAETLQELENQAKTGVVIKSTSKGDHEVGWQGLGGKVKNKVKDEDQDNQES